MCWSKWYLRMLPVLLALCMMSPEMGTAAGLLPSADSLFGVTMPDMRFAIEREADEIENSDKGQTYIFHSFTNADYQNLDRYLASDGMKLKASSAENKMIHADLEKEDAVIACTYD